MWLYYLAIRRTISREILWSKYALLVIGWIYLGFMGHHLYQNPDEFLGLPSTQWMALKEAWFFIGSGIIALSSPGFLRLFSKIQSQPARFVVIAYTGASLLGSILLILPVSLQKGVNLGQFDAFFTAVSALSGAGLVVANTALTFSTFGHFILLILMQAGGIGVITFSALLLLFIGKELGLRERKITDDTERTFFMGDLKNFLILVAIVMCAFEITGTILIYPWMATKFEGFWMILFHSVFHSISAFCTSGFTTLVHGMEEARGQAWPMFVIGFYAWAGMLGLPLIVNLYHLIRPKKMIRRLAPYAKLELFMAINVLIFGALAFVIVEFQSGVYQGWKDIFLNAFFMSAMRNAGFNSIPIADLGIPTVFILMSLMMIGGAPMSTAGGLKTSTFGIIFLFVRSFLAGTHQAHFAGRSIPFIFLSKAISLIVLYCTVLFVGFVALVLTQPHGALELLFEAVSALSVQGFSYGITPSLDNVGKIILIILMMIGRIGLLTAVYALVKGRKPDRFRRPTGEFYVG